MPAKSSIAGVKDFYQSSRTTRSYISQGENGLSEFRQKSSYFIAEFTRPYSLSHRR